MPDNEGFTLRRRRLGAELKRCREAAGLTQEQVSHEFEWHSAKVTRIEAARVGVTPRDVKDLLSLYGVQDREYREFLLRLTRSGRERGWWSQYRDVLPVSTYVQLETDASVIRHWEPVVVPGLLQTEAYMRALFFTRPNRMPGEVDRMVSLRLARQRRLSDSSLRLCVVLDESAIRKRVGGAATMAGQLRHLAEMARRPTVDLRILPLEAGEHPLLDRAVVILEFDDAPDLNVVYIEQYRGTHHYMKEPAEVALCQASFETVTSKCLDHQQTLGLLEHVIGRLTVGDTVSMGGDT